MNKTYQFPAQRYFLSDLKSRAINELVTILSKEPTEEEQPHLILGTVSEGGEVQKGLRVSTVHPAVKRVLDPSRQQFTAQLLLDSDVIIYDLNTCDLQEAELAIKTLKLRELDSPKTIICISSVMVWENSEPKEKAELEEEPQEGEEPEEDLGEEPLSEEGQAELEAQQENQEQKEEEEDPESKKVFVKFTEKDYYLRDAAQERYEQMKSIETLCISASLDKPNLKSYVVCAGVQYGLGEGVLYELFRQAWLQQPPALKVFGKGDNRVPMIHTCDLATFVKKVAEVEPDQKYLLAIDHNKKNKYKRIVEAISKGVGTGLTEKVDEQPEQKEFGLNLMMKPSSVFDKYLGEDQAEEEEEPEEEEGEEGEETQKKPKKPKYRFRFDWVAKEGLQSKMEEVVQQFNQHNTLKPIKILLTGEPGIGKTYLAQKLAKHYNVRHLLIKDMVQAAMAQNTEWAEEIKAVHAEQKEKLIEAENERLEKVREQKEKDNQKILPEDENVDESKLDVRLPDKELFRIVRWQLESTDCQNRGFVLDGWPKSYKQAQQLFLEKIKRFNEDGEEEEEEEPVEEEEEEAKKEENQREMKNMQVNRKICPESVVVLHSSHPDVVYHRLQGLSQEQLQGTHWNQEGLDRRYALYHAINREVKAKGAKVLLDFFKDNQVDTTSHQLSQTQIGTFQQVREERDLFTSVSQFVERNGAFNNYQFLAKEQECNRQAEVQNELSRMKQKHEDYCVLKDRNEQEKEQRELVNEEYKMAITQMKAEDRKTLEAMSSPLQKYLEKYVIPYLVEGLQELCSEKKEDGLDHLAEFLFKKSQQLPRTEFEQ